MQRAFSGPPQQLTPALLPPRAGVKNAAVGAAGAAGRGLQRFTHAVEGCGASLLEGAIPALISISGHSSMSGLA